MTKRLQRVAAVAWLCVAAGTPTPARADAPPSAADFARLAAEVSRLQQELKEQKQLLLNVMQSEQQRYDVLLQLIRSGGTSGASLPPPPAPPAPAGAPSAKAEPPNRPSATTGVVSGRVTMPAGAEEAWVYVEGLKGGPRSTPSSVEIRQRDKQFTPRAMVVPVGTSISFPNADTIFHNVFSRTPGSAFDLGSVKPGEQPKTVVLTKAGQVEIFCNMHGKMRADVLIVPNGYYAKVSRDGSFQISGVPLGSRRIVLWGPELRPAASRVEVTPRGAQVAFNPEKGSPKPHSNKFGQAYGSYDE